MFVEKENRVLNEELKKLEAVGGTRFGVLDDAAGPLAGGLGATWARSFVLSECCSREMVFRGDPETVLRAAYEAFRKLGRVKTGLKDETPYPCVSGVIGGGFLNLNQAVVHFELLGCEDDRCRVCVSAFAKENLINQKTARKAACRLLEQLARNLILH